MKIKKITSISREDLIELGKILLYNLNKERERTKCDFYCGKSKIEIEKGLVSITMPNLVVDSVLITDDGSNIEILVYDSENGDDFHAIMMNDLVLALSFLVKRGYEAYVDKKLLR